MKIPRLRTLSTPLILLTSSLHGAVSITNPPVPDPFPAIPAATEWSTLPVGTATDTTVTTLAQFDAKIIAAADAATIATTLGTSGTFDPVTGPSASNVGARQNTGTAASAGGVTFLQTRPTGLDYILLKASLVNSTGAPLNAVKIAYDYSKFAGGNSAAEQLKGFRVYWSLDGTAGSWKLIDALSVDTTGAIATPQAISANIALTTPLADGGTMFILWADQNSPGDDASYHITNFAASPGVNCAIAGTAITPVRNPGVNPDDPADDSVTFSTIITGTGDVGPGWIVASGPMSGTAGNYGSSLDFNLPIGDFTAGPLTLRVQDQATAACFFEKTITAPPFVQSVTTTNSPKITFTPSAVGDGSYAAPLTTISEPGWSGGTTAPPATITVSNVQTQPTPSTSTQKYFHITTNGTSFTTDPVNVNAIKGGLLKGEIDFSFYSTSTTAFDATDVLNSRLEIAQDGNFANTAVGNIITTNIKDMPAGEGPAFSASIAVGPDYINLGTATGPAFPATDFAFHKFAANVVVPAGASNPHARIIVQTITDVANTEHLLVDNVTFSANTQPSLDITTAGPAIWSNNGTVTATDDSFTAPVNITSFNMGASPGWTSNETPARSGLYTDANPVTFGPYPGRTAVGLQLHDQTTPAVQSAVLNLAPPPATITATLVAGSEVRNPDNSVTFQVAISGNNGGPEFRMASYPAVATTPSLALTNAPTQIAVTLSPAPEHGTVVVAFTDASYPNVAATASAIIPNANATQYIIGQKDLGLGLQDVVTDPLTGLAPEWFNYPTIRATEMTSGGGVTTKVVLSEKIDLTGVNGTVNFSARLRAIDRTAGFEAADTFLAELIIDDNFGAPVSLITAYDANLNTVMNGADDAVPANDEFNVADATDGSYVSDFNLSFAIPDAATSVQLRLTAVNDSVNETFIVENVLFTNAATPNGDSDGDGVTDANEAIQGTSPTDPNDVLRLSQSPGDATQIGFPSKAGRFYRVYVSDDAAEATHLTKWNDAGMATIAGDGTNKQFNITVQAGEARRFYRLDVMTVDGPWPATRP